MNVSDFDYALPKELIAQMPVEPRDASRMMVLNRQTQEIENRHFFDLPEYLGPDDVLVFNKSKVIPARIVFEFQGKACELFFVREVDVNVWEVMVKPGKLFKEGARVTINSDVDVVVEEVRPESEHGHRIIRILDGLGRDRFELLHALGSIPLPPYIESQEGVSKYQNVYATEPGSVAAPTAGFHFTEVLLERLRVRGVHIEFLTLHVGPGTFLPVMVEDILQHVMHEEFFSLSPEVAERLNQAKRGGKRIISVGTTTTRVLESCSDGRGGVVARDGSTKLFIYPGYTWTFIDALITNFHLPKSTLLMLVAAFGGQDLAMRAYKKAVEERYRFFSFGDGMFISS